MHIESRTARIEVKTNKLGAWMDVVSEVFGYCAAIRFMPDHSGTFYLAKKASNPLFLYLLMVPSAEWKDDLEKEGFEIVQCLSSNPTGLRCAGLGAHKQDPVVGIPK